MFLAKVEGSVVATKKDPAMSGRKMLLLRPQLVDEKDPTKFRPGANTIVAVDCLGAGIGEIGVVLPGQQRPPRARHEGRAR
jgi:ethanolamine utilization protein EutN